MDLSPLFNAVLPNDRGLVFFARLSTVMMDDSIDTLSGKTHGQPVGNLFIKPLSHS